MQAKLVTPGRRSVVWIIFLSLALATGCNGQSVNEVSVPTNQVSFPPGLDARVAALGAASPRTFHRSSSKFIGSFLLASSTSPIFDLLEKLRLKAPEEMEKLGLTGAVFDVEPHMQWVTVIFSNPNYYRWRIGIQFIRTPSENALQAHAYIRTFALTTSTISEDELNKIVPKLQQALQAASILSLQPAPPELGIPRS